jgi:hypothetical protein
VSGRRIAVSGCSNNPGVAQYKDSSRVPGHSRFWPWTLSQVHLNQSNQPSLSNPLKLADRWS